MVVGRRAGACSLLGTRAPAHRAPGLARFRRASRHPGFGASKTPQKRASPRAAPWHDGCGAMGHDGGLVFGGAVARAGFAFDLRSVRTCGGTVGTFGAWEGDIGRSPLCCT